MKNESTGSYVLWAILLGLYVSPVIGAGKVGGNLFKWTDENGTIHYGDHIPPKYSQQRQERMNKYGITVDVTNAAKTKEQLAEDERKERLQAEETHKFQKQRDKDRALLTSYPTENDLETGYKSKLEAIDGIIRITESNINLLRGSIADLTEQAAKNEKAGKTVGEKIRKDISVSYALIAQHEAYIESKRKEKEELYNQFDLDLKRFRELRGIPNNSR